MIFKTYNISPYHSNCMKSNNPHSGIQEVSHCRTLDNMNCGYPACNQGGLIIVQISTSIPGRCVALEGNGSRPSHRGDGYIETDKMYTLNGTEVHGVAYEMDW